jgi:hypothetical protein
MALMCLSRVADLSEKWYEDPVAPARTNGRDEALVREFVWIA